MDQHSSLIDVGDAIGAEIEQASRLLAQVGAAISIFGSARMREDSPEYAEAQKLAELLARQHVAVISGGGPGIMEAANRGAHAGGGVSIGLNITLPHEQSGNPYQTISAPFVHFPSRKTTFVRVSDGFAVFPGGFGTLDELFEVLTLVQTGKNDRVPVVLVGRQFWSGLVAWVNSELVQRGMISPTDPQLMVIADNAEHAAQLLTPAINRAKQAKQANPKHLHRVV